MAKTQKRQPGEVQVNRNGIPINRHISLALLKVMGVEDPFEGKRFDPQFESVRSIKGQVAS